MKASSSRSLAPNQPVSNLVQREELLSVVRALVEQPTAPFHEEAVRDEIVAQLRECPHVKIEHDAYGNMIARYHRSTRAQAQWAFAAHMDHPGWVRGEEGNWRFLGSVAERFLIDPKRREFGDFAMWDLPAFELKDDQIHSRACDDLLGCAEIICLFRELEAAKANAHCLGIFTRAEEVGFWGAIQLAPAGTLPKDITVFSLETSTPRGGAEIGRGPIVRVGDRLSIFDSGETARLISVAAANKIPVQRCLLDGGACEASAYQLYGYRSVAASIALGNYHNCAPDGSIQCEYVSVEDYANMVRLCVAIVSEAKKSEPSKALRDSLEKRAAGYDPLFRKI
jgi:putative aminopeptidase FrvX